LHENVRLVLYLTRQPAIIKADLNLIHQLVVNIAVNALEAMPERGHLTIETSNIEFNEPHVTRAGIVPSGSYVCLRIKDTGRGMTPDVISHLYEPFFSTKPREKHSGLGLATAYGIVHQSSGYINASSEPGRGTTFEIYFPRVESLTRLAPGVGSSVRGSETVMVVEDDVVLREVVVEYLTSLDYFVLEAHDCADALELCRRHSSPVDLLITDVVMPDMNGPTLAEHVREILPNIKVLFMSGYPNADMQRAESSEAKLNFLAKPFNASELGVRVRAILDSQ
jgi:two-component system cell cycle sensor histidine kinase/response regulator CckA